MSDLKTQRAALSGEISKSKWAKRLRWTSRGLIVIVVADIVITVVLSFGLQHARHEDQQTRKLAQQTRVLARQTRALARRIEANSESAYHACVSLNKLRAADLNLWEPVLLKPVPPSQRQEAIEFKRRLEEGFKQENCTPLLVTP